MCWTQDIAQEVQGRGKKISGNKRDEKEKGANVMEACTGERATIKMRPSQCGWKRYAGDGQKEKDEKWKTKQLLEKDMPSEDWWRSDVLEVVETWGESAGGDKERSSKLADNADTKINQRDFFFTYRFKKKKKKAKCMTILSRAESHFLCHHSSAFFPIFPSLAMALLSPAVKMMWWRLAPPTSCLMWHRWGQQWELILAMSPYRFEAPWVNREPQHQPLASFEGILGILWPGRGVNSTFPGTFVARNWLKCPDIFQTHG